MLQAKFVFRSLEFNFPGHTSRGILYSKPSYFIILKSGDKTGTGECSIIPGLHPEYDDSYEPKLTKILKQINKGIAVADIDLSRYPSIAFGLETALADLQTEAHGLLYPSLFTEGKAAIPINGLIWMGDISEMKLRIREKLEQGYRCLKLKVGAVDFESEINLLQEIRKEFSPQSLEIRLDANGAFTPKNALQKIHQLSPHNIHSLEQPIKPNQWEQMAEICTQSSIPVALDEELIGIRSQEDKENMLQSIKPAYIILKPGLLGGFKKSEEWIALAKQNRIGWWATSALESNIGLNAIAQWVYTQKPDMVQGLGTGQVFKNNIPSLLFLNGPKLGFNAENLKKFKWNID